MNRRALTLSILLAAAVPAGIALYWSVAMALGSPEPWEWFRRARLNPLALREGTLFDFEFTPRLVLFRLGYEGLLFIPGSDFGKFAAVGWLLVGLTCVGVWRLAAHGAGRGGPLLAGAVLALSLAAFSPAFGANWLLGARFRVFFPALALVACALALTRGERWRLRFWAAALIASAAIFVDRSGVAVWMAIVPLVAVEAFARRVRRPGLFVVVWCIVGNAATIIAYSGAKSIERLPGIVGRLSAMPGDAGRFVLGRLGSGAPFVGTWRDEPTAAIAGGVLLALLVIFSVVFLARCRHRAVIRRAAPWLASALFGVISALTVADQYFDLRTESALLREVGWSVLFLPVGIAGLGATLAGRGGRIALAVLAPAVVAVLLIQWNAAWGTVRERQALLRQGEALLVFSEAATTELPDYPIPPVYYGVDRIALQRHGRLRRPRPVTSMTLTEIATEADANGRGRVTSLRGLTVSGESPREGLAADLILMTRQEAGGAETIVGIAVPHRLGDGPVCQWVLDASKALPSPSASLRLYAFDYDARRAYRLRDRLRVREGRLERATGGGQ